MQHVYSIMFRDILYAQVLAVWEETKYAAFFFFFPSDFFKFTDLQRICLFYQWQLFFQQCQSREDLLNRGKKTTLLEHLIPGGHWLKSSTNHSQHERSNTDIVFKGLLNNSYWHKCSIIIRLYWLVSNCCGSSPETGMQHQSTVAADPLQQTLQWNSLL